MHILLTPPISCNQFLTSMPSYSFISVIDKYVYIRQSQGQDLWYTTWKTFLQADTDSLKLPLGAIIQPVMKTYNSTIPKPIFLYLVHKDIKKTLLNDLLESRCLFLLP